MVTKDNIINITNKDTLDTILNQYVYCDYTVIAVYNEYMCRKDKESEIFKRLQLTSEDIQKEDTEVLYYRGYQNYEIYTYNTMKDIAIYEIEMEYKNLIKGKNIDLLDVIDKIGFDKMKKYNVSIEYDSQDKILMLHHNNGLEIDV